MKTTNPIASLFVRSPFGPMKEHISVVVQCASEMVPFFEAVLENDRDRLLEIKERIFELEEKADEVKNDIRTHLPKGLFLPVDRRDLLDLLRAQDSVADRAQDVAGLLVLGRLEVPASLRDGMMEFVLANVEAARLCKRAIDKLDELLETGFRGRASEHVDAIVKELALVESKSDKLEMALTEALLVHENEISTASFVLWYDLIRTLADIADNAENVGDRLRLLIAR